MPPIHQEVPLDATPARVYRVLMEPGHFAAFTGHPADIGPNEGDAFSIFGGRIVGRHLQLVPGRRIVQSWRAASWADGIESIVRIELQPRDQGTLLILNHEGIPDEKVGVVASHWENRCWPTLRDYAPPPAPALVGAVATLSARVREAFGRPSRVAAEPYLVDLDGGGRFLVERLIAQLQNPTILEIGSFLGGSTLRWLNVSPAVRVVAVDPWVDGWAGDFVASDAWWFTWPKPSPEIVRALNAPDGLFHTFLANLARHADRVVPVRGLSGEMLPRLAELGLDPGLVYIDAEKQRSDLDLCARLWPGARLTGDDFLWNEEEGYPMQRHVRAFAAEHRRSVRHSAHTWVLA